MFKEGLQLGGVFERQGLVAFWSPVIFYDPGSEGLINKE